jgi:quinol monooxygenase YgiN
MKIGRRELFSGAIVSAAGQLLAPAKAVAATNMYGLIAKLVSVAGRRDELIAILAESTVQMPGCVSYVIAKDAEDENAIWVTEVWESVTAHDESLSLPAVKAAIGKGRPLIADFARIAVTNPVAGVRASAK